MECTFEVGMRVVCVGDDLARPPEGHLLLTKVILPIKGQVYVVRSVDIGLARGVPCLRLEEIPDQEAEVFADGEVWIAEITFEASDFRPIVERKTDISQFTALLNSQPEKVVA